MTHNSPKPTYTHKLTNNLLEKKVSKAQIIQHNGQNYWSSIKVKKVINYQPIFTNPKTTKLKNGKRKVIERNPTTYKRCSDSYDDS